jgi:hypothetical protein
MSELSGGLLALEVKEREAYYRDRARRELVGVVTHERAPRRRLPWARRAA